MVSNRRALLIANESYVDPGLTRLRAPKGDVRSLAAVLGDEAIGGFEVNQLIDHSADDVKQQIEGFFDEARLDDLLLLYLSGHGVLSKTGRLYFATINTKLRLLRATAIEDSFVHEVMQQSRARSVVLMLDCCHSGAFVKGLVPKSALRVDMARRFEGHGHITLTASTALEYAFEEAEGKDTLSKLGVSPPSSLFTRCIVEGLRTGEADADNDGQVSIDDLYDYVYEQVRARSPFQTPGKSGSGHGDILIARSRQLAIPRDGLRGEGDHRHTLMFAHAEELGGRGDLGGAKAAYQGVMDSGSGDWGPRAATALGDLLRAQGDLESARAAYQRAINSGHPDEAPKAWFVLAELFMEVDDFDGARASLQHAMNSAHKEWAPRSAGWLGELLECRGDAISARASYQVAIDSRHPDEAPWAAGALGGLLRKQGDLAGARDAYERAIASGHRDEAPWAANRLGDMLADEGDSEGAGKAYHHAIVSGNPDESRRAAARVGRLGWPRRRGRSPSDARPGGAETG